MTFWSGEKLRREVPAQGIVEPFDPDMVDCSAYTLTLGPEFFISPDFSVHPAEIRKRRLLPATEERVSGQLKPVPGEGFAIPPGQFAYLLTEEIVRIPNDVMGFISLKFGVKGPGLINVSGFHVDPGYYGRLVFSVYNAGPRSAPLHRQQPVFLLWLADLDQPSSEVKSPSATPSNNSIPQDMIAKVDRRIHSLQGLSERLERLNGEVELMKSVAKAVAVIAGIIVAVASLIVAVWALGPSSSDRSPPRVYSAQT